MFMAKIKKQNYGFKGKVWKYQGTSGWFFVTLPKRLASTIRKNHGVSEEGWGRLKVEAAVEDHGWKTAIWFDTKAKSYLLPIKASVRKAVGIRQGATIEVKLSLQEENPRMNFLR